MTSKTTLLAVGVAAIVILGGVGVFLLLQDDDGGIEIYIKDAPADWTYINVTFSSVAVHKADADNDTNPDDTVDDGGEWINVPLAQQTIDLRAYVDVSALLAAGNISTGKYTQVRIIVDSVSGTKVDGTQVEFEVPSGELKINMMFEIEENETSKLTVDIDLAASILNPTPGVWIFKPVLGSIVEA